MRLPYDPCYNIAHIRFQEKEAQVQTLCLSAEVNVDLGPDGRIYGIELLNANQQLGILLDRKLVVENKVTGKEQELLLS